jgi:HD-like signal output (HDOD) protein
VKRILFVDDESNILDGLRRMLHAERKRWDMEFALGGEAALQACQAHSFDVVVSDMRMPGMDGAALLSQIRESYPNTARVVLSGHSESEMTNRSLPVAHRFLAKPCNASDLQSTIEALCTLQDLLSTDEIRRVVGAIGELPSLSGSYACLMQAVNNPDSGIDDVAKILQRDMAMSAKVLQLVNSAFFGLARNETSLRNAASFLGMETIKNLALTSEVFRVFVPDPTIPMSVCESIQQHAQRTAAIVAKLPLDRKTRDVTVLSALLHDIGRLALASKMPDKFCAVLALAKERGIEDFEAEEEILGTSHAEVGSYLLGLWGIPNLAVEAIAHHHRPTRVPHTGFDTSAAVYVADLLDRELDTQPKNHNEFKLSDYDRDCLDHLGLLPVLSEFRGLANRIEGRD